MPFDEWKIGDVLAQVAETYDDIGYNDKYTNGQLSEAIRTLDSMKQLFISKMSSAGSISESSSSSDILRSGTFQCRLCEQKGRKIVLGSFGSLKRHFASLHETTDALSRCPVENCGRSYSRRDKLREHLFMAHADAANRADLNKSSIKPAPPITCPICDCGISSWDQFWGHIKEHSFIPPGRERKLQP